MFSSCPSGGGRADQVLGPEARPGSGCRPLCRAFTARRGLQSTPQHHLCRAVETLGVNPLTFAGNPGARVAGYHVMADQYDGHLVLPSSNWQAYSIFQVQLLDDAYGSRACSMTHGTSTGWKAARRSVLGRTHADVRALAYGPSRRSGATSAHQYRRSSSSWQSQAAGRLAAGKCWSGSRAALISCSNHEPGHCTHCRARPGCSRHGPASRCLLYRATAQVGQR